MSVAGRGVGSPAAPQQAYHGQQPGMQPQVLYILVVRVNSVHCVHERESNTCFNEK